MQPFKKQFVWNPEEKNDEGEKSNLSLNELSDRVLPGMAGFIAVGQNNFRTPKICVLPHDPFFLKRLIDVNRAQIDGFSF